MFWKKKKLKRKQPVKKQIPKHIADNLKYGEKVAEGFKEEVSEKPNRKKPAGKNSEKHLDARKEFLRVFRQLTYRHRSWDVWSDFIIMFACALSNPVDKNHFDEREALYLRTIKKYNKQEQPLFSELAAYTVVALEENQEQDFLGSIYTELGLNSKEHEQIFTPYHICELMAEITMEDVVEKGQERRIHHPERSLLRRWSYFNCRYSCSEKKAGKSQPELPESYLGSRSGYRHGGSSDVLYSAISPRRCRLHQSRKFIDRAND